MVIDVRMADDPVRGPWKKVARLTVTGARASLEVLESFPAVQHLNQWCREGILTMEEDADGETVARLVKPGDEQFLELAQRRLGYCLRLTPSG